MQAYSRRIKMGTIYDFDDGDFAYAISDNMAIDSDGGFMMRMSDSMAMDMDSGELHFISGWDDEDDEPRRKSAWDDEDDD